MLLIVGGLAILTVGGDWLVGGSVDLARRWGISPLLIGSTLVAFGTSLPELVVCIDAALIGRPGIAIGNVVGSNIANVLLILGLTAVVRPILCERRAIFRDAAFALFATALFIVFALATRIIEPWQGMLMLFVLIAFQTYAYLNERAEVSASAIQHRRQAGMVEPPTRSTRRNAGLVLLGLAALPIGAHLLVVNATILAGRFGVSDAVIGLTIVAIGTSLPELATSLVAAARRHGDIAFGNIMGSNIFNLLAILGTTSLLGGIPIPGQIIHLDMWLMLASMLLLLPVIFTDYRIGRIHGLMFFVVYIAYIALLYVRDNGAMAGM